MFPKGQTRISRRLAVPSGNCPAAKTRRAASGRSQWHVSIRSFLKMTSGLRCCNGNSLDR